jgi:hypothetical protein
MGCGLCLETLLKNDALPPPPPHNKADEAKGITSTTWYNQLKYYNGHLTDINIAAYLLKARTVKPPETAVAKERLCKHAHC